MRSDGVSTRAEAEAKFEAMQDLIDDKTGIEFLSKRLDFDLTGYDPDSPPPEVEHDAVTASQAGMFLDIARRENYTIRELWRHIAGTRGHLQTVGSPTDVADFMEEWFTTKGCDGFNVMVPMFPQDLNDFVTLVVPELQRRGLFRKAYEGTTLRANLGLERPRWPSGKVQTEAAAE